MWCAVQCVPYCVSVNREYTESGTGGHGCIWNVNFVVDEEASPGDVLC